ncbi:hypothetical protein B0H10DRAFT_1993249 [Mycena sp. CBHHK59/15]|nr:hypothetical protein B0H10DRAFT_1993249 [Mycena sp. CBHHK59/15]
MATKFIHRELKALPRYARRNGPLPAAESPGAVVLPNPFLPWRNPKTGKWAPPKFSLRQQADLIKKAKATGTAHLLPPGLKLPEPKVLAPSSAAAVKPPLASTSSNTSTRVHRLKLKQMQKQQRKDAAVVVEWDRKPPAKNVAGAATGTRLYAAKKKMFKGSKSERTRSQRAWRTWVLLHDMRKRIRRYRNTYVHKRPNPLKGPRSMQKKLPF